MKKYIITYTIIFFLVACGGSSKKEDTPNPTPPPTGVTPKPTDNLPIPDNRDDATYQILIIGNSHVGGVQSLLTKVFANSGKSVSIETRTGQFLDTIVNDQSIIDLIKNKKWTHVILQGQKYSQSQTKLYPTGATVTWIQRAKAVGATPILFPEHPLFGKPLDGLYVHNIHKGIAGIQSSCVAPVGLTWNKVLSISPSLDLHQADGNHAKELGILLTSTVLYEAISGKSADLLPFNSNLPADSATQALFGQITSETSTKYVPCEF